MRVVSLEEIPESQELRLAWNDLALRMEQPEIFYTHEWAVAVERAYKDALHPLLFLAYDEVEALCGVAALATEAKGGRICFLCATTGDYCDFISVPERRLEFVEAVVDELQRRGIKKMALANLPADSATMTAVSQAATRHGCWCFARTGYVCAQLSLARLERSTDGKPVAPGKKRLQRFAKAMAREGPLRFEHRRTWADIAPMLPAFVQAHVARFLETGRISNLANARRQIFIQELSKQLSGPGWLVLSRMSMGERAVAWHYGFQFHGTWFWYQPTFDSSVEKYSPGVCLLTHVVQEAIEDPTMKTLDLGLGSEGYKTKFANQTRETLYVTLHRSLVEHLSTMLRYRAAAVIKQVPALERCAGSVRTRLRGLRSRWPGEGGKRTLAWAGRLGLRALWASDEVFFFEWEHCEASSPGSRRFELRPLDIRQLADAAIKYEGDEATLNYILRSAKRLRAGGAEGFILAGADGSPLHFAWVASFNGFYFSELNATLPASLDSIIMFDSWTPPPIRGQGYSQKAIKLIAGRMKAAGKRPWIFGAATNPAWLHAIEKSGFKYRSSLKRKRIFFFDVRKDSPIDGKMANSAPAF